MAIKRWVSTNGNWGSTASWDDGAVPINGDTVLFDASLSNVPVTSGLDQSAVYLDRLWVSENYTANIGASGNHLIIACDTTFTHRGRGTVYYTATNNTYHPEILVESPNLTNAMVLDGSGLNIVTMDVQSGKVTVGGNIDDINVLMVSGPRADVTIQPVTGGSGDIANIYMRSGRLTNWRSIDSAGSVNVSGGSYTHEGSATINRLWLAGGRVFYNSSGTLSFAYVQDGILDFNQNAVARTVTNLFVTIGGQYKTNSNTTISFLRDLREEMP